MKEITLIFLVSVFSLLVSQVETALFVSFLQHEQQLAEQMMEQEIAKARSNVNASYQDQ